LATIMVVDDEPDIRMLVRLTLGLDGHEIVEAGDGAEALAGVAERRPDLIILDVMMPRVSGWDTLTQLKAHDDPAVREIPVVMLTALSAPIDRAKGGIEGAVRYLAKPIDTDDLRASVTDALAGGPEPVQRRRAQQQALEDLARMERDDQGLAAVVTDAPRPRLSGLETARSIDRPEAATPTPDLAEAVARLTDKQRELLEAVRVAPTVMEAAANLGMSRSNVYASLRRITRRLQVRTVSELLQYVRAGHVRP
jgi:CheY-like chemotaxis protein/DNA-binding CsgD family transcriptional regulator